MIVCAHGYSGNARDFDYLARALATQARVICIDVAGRGESDWFAHSYQYHFPQFLSDIDALLAHLGVKEIDWIGTSMGGLLGMLLASRPSNPIRRLVMNDIGAYLPMDSLQAIARNLQAPEHFASLDEIEAHMRHTHRTWGEITDEQWKHFAVHGSRPDGDGYRLHFDPQITTVARPLPIGPGLFFWDAWYRVRCSVLLLRGADSTIFPPDVAATMVDVKPETELVEVADCGHAPALMSKEQIATVVDYLLRPAPQSQWQRIPFSSSPGSSKTPMRSATRSRGSASSPPSPSPT